MEITQIRTADQECGDADSLELDGDELTPETAIAIASWLVAKYRSKMIYDAIFDIFGEMSVSSRDAVYKSVCNIISGRYSLAHLEYIKKKILDFFEFENEMNVDGFINFRLKAYKDEIKTLVEECGCDVLFCDEYKEYIELIDLINSVLQHSD